MNLVILISFQFYSSISLIKICEVILERKFRKLLTDIHGVFNIDLTVRGKFDNQGNL